MLIEIKGVQFVNKGAELMLHAIIAKLVQHFPEVEICLAPDKNSPYLSRARMGAYQKLILRKNIIDLTGIFYLFPKSVRNYFKEKWGIVTEADIDVILDASGFNYGDQWSNVLLKQAAIETKRLKNKNKHYIFMPQALGPFSSVERKSAAKKAFETASIVFARENTSFEYAQVCAPSANIILSADFTNLVIPEPSKKYEYLKGSVAIIPNSNMIGEKNPSAEWRSHYVNIVLKVINAFTARGETVFFLNHEGKADRKICNELNGLLSKKIEIIEPNSALEVKAIINQSKTVFCSRFHGCISALSYGIPCIGTSWSHKYEELYAEYNVEQLLLKPELDANEISNIVNYTLDKQDDITTLLQPNIDKFKQRSETMWDEIFQTLA